VFDPKNRHEPGVALLARRLYPKAGPVIVPAADVPRLRPQGVRARGQLSIAGLPAKVCILTQMNQPQPQSLSGVVTSSW